MDPSWWLLFDIVLVPPKLSVDLVGQRVALRSRDVSLCEVVPVGMCLSLCAIGLSLTGLEGSMSFWDSKNYNAALELRPGPWLRQRHRLPSWSRAGRCSWGAAGVLCRRCQPGGRHVQLTIFHENESVDSSKLARRGRVQKEKSESCNL